MAALKCESGVMRVSNVLMSLQRACYLSLNPQKDETLETEKAQYVLPDGSTLNVSPVPTDWSFRVAFLPIPLTCDLAVFRSAPPGSAPRSCCSDPT